MNKLVDSCYSFWIGAIFAILHREEATMMFSGRDLAKYILQYCQSPTGGMRDKPGKVTSPKSHTKATEEDQRELDRGNGEQRSETGHPQGSG